MQQVIERQTTFGADDARRPVGLDHSIERSGANVRTVAVDANVSIRSRGSDRQHGLVAMRQGCMGIGQKGSSRDHMWGPENAPPRLDFIAQFYWHHGDRSSKKSSHALPDRSRKT